MSHIHDRTGQTTDEDFDDFEDRLSTLLVGDHSTARALSAGTVIQGARRRRSRHRVTGAGSALAVVAVAAVTAAAFSGGASHNAPTPGAQPDASTTPVRDLDPSHFIQALGTTTQIGSGTVNGHTWSAQVGIVASWKTFFADHPQLAWADPSRDQGRGTSPDGSQFPPPKDGPMSFTFYTVDGRIGPSQTDTSLAPADPLLNFGGATLSQVKPGGVPTDDLSSGVVDPRADHLVFTFAGRTATVPAVDVGGTRFVAFGLASSDGLTGVTEYDASGHVLATEDGASVTAQMFLPIPMAAGAPPATATH